MSHEAPDSASLLDELRSSQTAVAGEIAALSSHLVPLGEAVAAIAAAMAELQAARAMLAAERLAALNAIQAKLQEAVTVIRVVSQEARKPDPFTDPRRLGY